MLVLPATSFGFTPTARAPQALLVVSDVVLAPALGDKNSAAVRTSIGQPGMLSFGLPRRNTRPPRRPCLSPHGRG
jgi:hypothetical protein